MTQIVGFGLSQEGPGAGLWMRRGVSYRAALLALLPTYAWIAEDLAAGAVAAWPCAVTGVQATQGTAGARPTQSATAFGGRPGLTFDGGDGLTTPPVATLAQPYAAVCAVRPTQSASFVAVFRSAAAWAELVQPGASWRVFAGANLAGGTATANTTAILRGVYDGATSALFQNGTSVASGNAGAGAFGGVVFLGSRENLLVPFIGVIADILIFSGTDYAARAEAADALMRAYYGI